MVCVLEPSHTNMPCNDGANNKPTNIQILRKVVKACVHNKQSTEIDFETMYVRHVCLSGRRTEQPWRQ